LEVDDPEVIEALVQGKALDPETVATELLDELNDST
jgi:hypothetical protein